MRKIDIVFWPLAKDGKYTCKSGYRFLKEEVEFEWHEDSELQDKHHWKGIWSLHVPNKVKNFIWRACQNLLPTIMNLDRRIVIFDPTCERCCEMPKQILHALWFCSGLDVLWSDMQFWAFRMTTQLLDFKELLSWILKEHQHPKLFAFMVWSRNQRNQTRVWSLSTKL